MVELYGWVQRLKSILQKLHVAVFKGNGEK